MSPQPPVGSLAWEKAGGPPLLLGERLALLGHAAALGFSHFSQRLTWNLRRAGLLPRRAPPPKVDLAAWAVPDSAVAREAERFLAEVSSPQMAHHSYRTYYFSGIVAELAGAAAAIDREALYVGALMHDVGLFDPSPPAREHCFTVGCAREARRLAKAAGWDEARQDRMAAVIVSNLNLSVPSERFGVDAHHLTEGGRVEVLAEEWKIHPDNLTEILERYPREGFAADCVPRMRSEARRNPGCRFACLHPWFPLLVRRSRFSSERAVVAKGAGPSRKR